MGNINKSLSDELYSLLDRYCTTVGGVLGVGISTPDGLEISSHFNGAVDPKMAHAVSSSLFTMSQHSAKNLGLNGFRRNLTYTDKGIIALQKVNNSSVVLVMLEPKANVGLAMVKMEDFVNEINRLL
jgi:predicted regulator of Ras-like GTPase activity (Roadblock/LC7/MglB family)